jgi:hypothetical protein
MMRTLLLFGLVSVAAAGAALAQGDSPRLDPGQRVRVHQGKRAVVGTLLSADSTAMQVLTSHTDTARLRRADVTGVDVSVGQKSKAASGALIGAGVGAVGGALAMVVIAGPEALETNDISPAVYVGGAAVIGLALGAGVGALVGASSQTDRWEPAVWPVLTFQPDGRAGKRIALGVRLSF